jgi:ATP/ADP translocase
VIGLVSVLAWAAFTFADVYQRYGTSYGSYTAFGGTGFHIAAIVCIVGAMVAARWLETTAAREVFLGAAVVPVCVVISEIAFVIRYGEDDGQEMGGVAFLVVPTIILLAVIGVALWTSRQRRPKVTGFAG